MTTRVEIFREGIQVGVCLGNSRAEGFTGFGTDLPDALEDLARKLRTVPELHDSPDGAQFRHDLNAERNAWKVEEEAVGYEKRAERTEDRRAEFDRASYSDSESVERESWIPLSHSPSGPLEEGVTAVGEDGAETLIYVQHDGDTRTTFKCLRYSPSREQWFQKVISRDR